MRANAARMNQVPQKNSRAVKGASRPGGPATDWRSPPTSAPLGPRPRSTSRAVAPLAPPTAAPAALLAAPPRGVPDGTPGGSRAGGGGPSGGLSAWPAALTVAVPGDGAEVGIVPGAPLDGGVVNISVESAAPPGAAGVFLACRSEPAAAGIVQRQVQVPGPGGERVELSWRAGAGLALSHVPPPADGESRLYRVRLERPCVALGRGP